MRGCLARTAWILALTVSLDGVGLFAPAAQAWSWTDRPAETRSWRDGKPFRILPGSAPARRRHRVPDQATETPVEHVKPARVPYTEEEQRLAQVPGFAGARFWSDSAADFDRALPAAPGSWLVLSSGGPDGGYGAGFLTGWSAAEARPEFSVVTGVGTGALTAVFAFAGPRYDATLRRFFTGITAGDVFEVRASRESQVDTAPLKREIAKVITDQFLADVAAEHERGRRLFVVTTNLDAGKPVVWNMGAVAARRDERALQLFRTILLAANSIPERFPPVYVEVEADGRRFAEMHVDGSVGGLTYLAPESYLFLGAGKRVPMTRLYVVLNGKATTEFTVLDRVGTEILGRSIAIVRRASARTELALLQQAAALADAEFNLALIDSDFDDAASGTVDPKYMNAVFERGVKDGKALQFAKGLPFRRQGPVTQVSGEGTVAK